MRLPNSPSARFRKNGRALPRQRKPAFRNLRKAIPLDSPFSVEIDAALNLPELNRHCFA